MYLSYIVLSGVLAYLVSMAIAAAVSIGMWYASFKRQKGPPSVDPIDLEMPTVAEGRPFSVIFGTCEVESYLVSWWGHVKTVAIWGNYRRQTSHGGPFNTKRKYYIRGWRYFVGAHFKLCHGPVDGIKRIRYGTVCVWPSRTPTTLAADGLTSAYINQPDIFGGLSAGGGVQGHLDFQYGDSAQTKNAYLEARQGSDIPASRGVVGVILKQIYIGTAPYPQTFSFTLKRTDIQQDGSAQWYPAKANINGNMNAAHVIRECKTNAEWGLGHSTGSIDDVSFEAGADTLYDEGFGISFEWNPESMTIDDYIDSVLGAINGMVEEDLETGKFVLKLTRDDYAIGDLETFTTGDIVEVEDYHRELLGKVTNELTVNYKDTLTNKNIPVTVHDIAMIDREGEVISDSVNYPMIRDDTLASEIAQRELAQLTSMPVPIKIRCKRTMQHLRPNDVFIFAWPDYNIEQLVVRILTADYGRLTDGVISFFVIEDIFKMGTAIYTDVPASSWTDPVSDPAAAPQRLLIETPYFEIYKTYGESMADLMDDGAAFLMVAATSPSDDSLGYELLVRDAPAEDFASDGLGDFTPNGTLDAEMLLNAEDVDITLNDAYALDESLVGTYAKVDDELVLVKTVDVDTGVVGVARGVLDTVPAAHLANARVWFIEAVSYIVASEYTTGDTPGVKILPQTGAGVFDEATAVAYNADAFDDRQVRPYPPGDFKIDGVSYPADFFGEPVLTWTHRDRKQQSQPIIEHDNVSIGPEPGTTYTIKIYDAGDVLRTTVAGLNAVTYTYLAATEIADCGSQQTQLRFVLYAVRGGYDSWQQYDITVERMSSSSSSHSSSSHSSSSSSQSSSSHSSSSQSSSHSSSSSSVSSSHSSSSQSSSHSSSSSSVSSSHSSSSSSVSSSHSSSSHSSSSHSSSSSSVSSSHSSSSHSSSSHSSSSHSSSSSSVSSSHSSSSSSD